MTTNQSKPDDGWTPPPGHATDEQENAVAAPASPTRQTTTEVATRQPQPPAKAPVSLGVPQTDIDKMFRLASAMSQSGLLPQSLRGKPSDVLVTVLYGQELGLAPMQAIQGIYVVNGRPTLAGQTWLSLARKHGHRVKVDEHTAESCTITLTRGDTGETHTETYTLTEAKAAGLTSKDTWKNHGKRMLLWRTVGHACTFLCPEIALGFSPDAEDEVAPAAPSLAEVAANRAAPVPEQRTAEPQRPIQDVTDAEFVDEPTPHADELAQLADEYQGGQGGDLFGAQGWPEVAQPGSGG